MSTRPAPHVEPTSTKSLAETAARPHICGHLDGRGVLTASEPDLAAEHFAFLIVGRSIDRVLFFGGPQTLSDIDVNRHVGTAVAVFLTAYRPHGG